MKDIYRGVDRLSPERMVQRLGTSISESLYHTTYSKQKTDGMETSVMQSVGVSLLGTEKDMEGQMEKSLHVRLCSVDPSFLVA